MPAKLNSVPNPVFFNSIRATMSEQFKERIPAANEQNMEKIGTAITSKEFEAQWNEWQGALWNKIGMTIFHEYTLQNPLADLIYGTMEFGDAIEEIGVDIVKGRAMDYGKEGESIDPFIKQSNQAKAMYHRINEPIQYMTTLEKDRIKRAFRSPNGVSRLYNMFIAALYSSANVDSWLMTKKLISMYVNDAMRDDVPLLDDQKQQVTPVTDKASGEDFVLAIRNIVSAGSFPNNAFNPMKIHKSLDRRDYILFVKYDILNNIAIKTLTNAFHNEELNMNVQIKTVDDFGPNTENVVAILAERNWLLITQQFDDMETIYNPRGRYWNYYLTRQMSFGATYFKDCIIFKDTAWA